MFKKIAVGTDGSDTASRAVEMALDIADRYGAQLLVFSAYRPIPPARIERESEEAPDEIQWTINPQEDVDAMLASVQEEASARGLDAIAFAREGDPALVLCDLAAEHGADLLVIGNKGIQRRILGSVPKTVSQNAPCSVVIAKTT
jgi:nucleotide-binding universal stress UspA family protein